MTVMATPPESTKDSLRQRLSTHAQTRWPQITSLDVRYRGGFAYVEAHLADGTTQPLIRLRYGGSAPHRGVWGVPGPPRPGWKTKPTPPDSPPDPPKKPRPRAPAPPPRSPPTHL